MDGGPARVVYRLGTEPENSGGPSVGRHLYWRTSKLSSGGAAGLTIEEEHAAPPSAGATGLAFFHGRGDEHPQSIRQLSKLPNLLVMARSTSGRYGLRTADQHPQAVICSVGRRNRMACSPRDCDGNLVRTLTCSEMRGYRCTLGDASSDLSSGPRTAYLYGRSRPHITAMALQQRQQLLRAVGSPSGKGPSR